MDKKNQKSSGKKIFTRDQKIEIIQKYLSTNLTQTELAKEYSINISSFIHNWINSLNFELKQINGEPLIDKSKLNSNLQRNLESLSLLKEKAVNIEINHVVFNLKQRYNIVREYLTTNLSQSEITKKHGIKWRSTISKWVEDLEKILNQKIKLNPEEKKLLNLIAKNKPIKKVRFHSKTFKESIVIEFMSSNMSKASMGRKYNISPSLLSNWISIYIIDNQKIQMPKSENFPNKLEIGFNNNLEKKAIEGSRVGKSPNLDLLNNEAKKNIFEKKITDSTGSKIKELEQKIKELEPKIEELEKKNIKKGAELEYERLKSHAYSTLIDIAETEFNIPIRKK